MSQLSPYGLELAQLEALERLSGGGASTESDKTGTGNGTATWGSAIKAIDAYNGGTGNMTLTAGEVSRVVPPGGRLCSFPASFTSVTIIADGAWILTGLA
jgi:hypothetical protein